MSNEYTMKAINENHTGKVDMVEQMKRARELADEYTPFSDLSAFEGLKIIPSDVLQAREVIVTVGRELYEEIQNRNKRQHLVRLIRRNRE